MSNSLTLKWGTVKGWRLDTEEAKAALRAWAEHGVSASAICQHDTPEQRQALLRLIELMDEIWLDWDERRVSREEAKAYIQSYGEASDET